MPNFTYQGKDRSGRSLDGQIEAASTQEAAAKLRNENLFITKLQPTGSLSLTHKSSSAKSVSVKNNASSHNKKSNSTRGKVKLKDLLVFTRQFGVMIGAGVNLVNCLNLLSQQAENKFLANIISEIRRDTESGLALNVALARFPKAFPPIFIHMVEAGEASGQLETVLQRLSEFLERQFELQKKVSGAMVYPSVIICVAIAVVTILMAFVVPSLMGMFTSAGLELPLPTQIVMAVSWFFQHFWYVVVGGIVGAVIGLKYYRNTAQGRYATDAFAYRLPVIGPVIQKVVSARFSRTLATLLESGVPIINSLELVEKTVGNAVVALAIAQSRENITKGSGIAKPLESTAVFPQMVTQMVAVGEETGELSRMLDQVADFFEKEAGYAIDGLTALIEPAIIVVLGGFVAIIISAIMLPMFDLSTGAGMK